MIDIEQYICSLKELLKCSFGSRLVYVGLQGSYLRNEATDSSDLDIMVVIDNLSVADLDTYRRIIDSMPYADKSCGFICSRADLASWNPLEIANLLHGTKDYYGVLHNLVPAFTDDDVRNFVKLSINNLYHEICHRYIHAETARSVKNLPAAYKGVFFILQNLYYLQYGVFIRSKAELLPLLEGKNKEVLKQSMELNAGISHEFHDSFTLLFTWCQETLQNI